MSTTGIRIHKFGPRPSSSSAGVQRQEWRDPDEEAEENDRAFGEAERYRLMRDRTETLRQVDCAECGKPIDKTAPNAYNFDNERIHWGCIE